MAIGAVKALQQSGYNLGGNTEKIIVVGCDGIPIAQDLIQKGFMTGTVELSAYDTAKDIYTISINLINNKNLIEGTNCTIDDTGKLVTIPYNGVLVNLD
jgi:methyl-galactoside transport system substrate-binding protein